jgi:hypothetical protein
MTSTTALSPSPSRRVHLVASLVAAASVIVGVIWDISWHRSIGRDTFWTPAHMAIYLGGVLAGTTCGWYVLHTTFAGTDAERAAGVRFWGFRGPLGAWVCIWGAIAMITSAPFDNWWHNAYGLDVKVLSPPHMLLALGFVGIQLGALLLLAARQNDVTSGDRMAVVYQLLFACAAGLLIATASIFAFEQIGFPNQAHNARYYKICGGIFPILLFATARASKLKWPATTAAVIFMAVNLVMILVLPLFPAVPKLAPIYIALDRFVPPPFPILLVVPAIVVDLVMRRGADNEWTRAALGGIAFVVVLFVVQWFVSFYLVSPQSENALFGAQRWSYFNPPEPWRYEFWRVHDDPVTPGGLVMAAALAVASARLGLWWGSWMARVRR